MVSTMTRKPSSSLCVPRFATPRTADRPTLGPAIGAVAERMGKPFMPWQQLVADVGGEIDPETGLPAYREVILTVPRQSGKTDLILAWVIQRAIGWDGPQRIAYSAQTGQDARKKFVDDWVPELRRRQRLLGIRRILRANGNEGLEFVNGSRMTLMASAAESGHGKTLDLGVKDEFFADWDDRRDQALIPAMATRSAAQILTASTAGTDESVPLNRAIERGRAAVETGARSSVAYFEWSADENADSDDRSVWWSCMPALGHTITEAVIEHARATLTDGEFRRAFLNLTSTSDERVIPQTLWNDVCSSTVGLAGQLVFGIDTAEDRSWTAIAAASRDAVVELAHYDRGTGWVVEWAKARQAKWNPSAWAVDPSGPAGGLIPDLRREGLNVVEVSGRDMAGACGRFYDDVIERRLKVRRKAALDVAVGGAVKRSMGDAWVWARRSAAVDIAPLVAATIARWVALTHEKEADAGYYGGEV